MKKIKEAESGGSMTEDEAFKAKEKVQKQVDEANKNIENTVAQKISELGEN